MRTLVVVLAACLSLVSAARAESFSSTTSPVNTLTIASNEVIFISGFATSLPFECIAIITQGNISNAVLFADYDLAGKARSTVQALAGPLQIQFPSVSVHMEFRRVQMTNVFTAFVGDSTGPNVNITAGQAINFFKPVAWTTPSFVSTWHAKLSLSNSVVSFTTVIQGGEAFTGPLSLQIRAGHTDESQYSKGLVTYFLTEEFAAIPAVGAIQVPPGQAQIQIEKSQDLVNWRTVFFNTINDSERGFYRLKIAK